MSAVEILVDRADVSLQPSPIEPSWIREGNPLARSKILYWSRDKTSFTAIWDCSPGVFNWIYTYDETLHILEGSVTLTDEVSGVRELGPGDVVFFPAGSQAVWKVNSYVRKVAFFRQTLPPPVSVALRLVKRLRDMLGSGSAVKSGLTEPVPAAAS
jgi:uncharacterized cupin superfamily protein